MTQVSVREPENPTYDGGADATVFGGTLIRTAEWFLSLFLVIGFLNSQLRFSAIASAPIKIVVASVTMVLLLTGLHAATNRLQWAPGPWLVGPFILYIVMVLLATVQYGASDQVVSVFLLCSVVAAMLIIVESLSPGSAVRCIRRAAVAHVVLALLLWGGPGIRADGGSHPITIGFAAGLLVFLSVSHWTLGRGDPFIRGAALLLGTAGLYAAFSRSAMIPSIMAVAAWSTLRPGLFRPVRVMAATAMGLAFGSDAWQIIVQALSRNDVQGFYAGTGRTVIWARVWSIREIYISHGIGLSNIDGSSVPGAQLLSGSLNLPTENSFLQALINAGAIGAILWCILVGACLTAIARGPWPGFTRLGLIALIAGGCIFNAGFSGSGFGWPMMIGLAASATNLSRSAPHGLNTPKRRTQQPDLQRA